MFRIFQTDWIEKPRDPDPVLPGTFYLFDTSRLYVYFAPHFMFAPHHANTLLRVPEVRDPDYSRFNE